MSLEKEIIHCANCSNSIRFGDKINEAELIGTIKGSAKGSVIPAAIAAAFVYSPPTVITKEVAFRAANKLGYDVRSPGQVANDTLSNQQINAINKQFEKLENTRYANGGWDWYVRLEGDGSIDGPYCSECK